MSKRWRDTVFRVNATAPVLRLHQLPILHLLALVQVGLSGPRKPASLERVLKQYLHGSLRFLRLFHLVDVYSVRMEVCHAVVKASVKENRLVEVAATDKLHDRVCPTGPVERKSLTIVLSFLARWQVFKSKS